MNGDDCLRAFVKWVERLDIDDWYKYMKLYAEYAQFVLMINGNEVLKPEQWLEQYHINHVFGKE